ncbi:C40 family peptidase [Nesterenkonia pannonica]|uniref:C40 family peptidase n=1 Tax=Nesterenkonia pannonica TaxID=1548602 RepID=UPI002164D6B5|nr:C40 family peptidase [Nesterenkonia pannonica]
MGTTVSISDLQAGDLVFWGGRGSAYHVAVYASGGMILDAGTPASGVTERRMFGGASTVSAWADARASPRRWAPGI